MLQQGSILPKVSVSRVSLAFMGRIVSVPGPVKDIRQNKFNGILYNLIMKEEQKTQLSNFWNSNLNSPNTSLLNGTWTHNSFFPPVSFMDVMSKVRKECQRNVKKPILHSLSPVSVKQKIEHERNQSQAPKDNREINYSLNIRKQKCKTHFERRITLITIKDVSKFCNLINKYRNHKQNIFHFTNSDEASTFFKKKEQPEVFIKNFIIIMDVKQSLYLSKGERNQFYSYLTKRQGLLYAFHFQHLLKLANQQLNLFKHNFKLETLYNYQFQSILKSDDIAYDIDFSLDHKYQESNQHFFKNCPTIVFASTDELAYEVSKIGYQSLPQDKKRSKTPLISKTVPLHKYSPTKDLITQALETNKNSYVRNLNSMKVSKAVSRNQNHVGDFFYIFNIDQQQAFYDLLFQCQEVFYNYSKSYLVHLADTFIHLFMVSNKLLTCESQIKIFQYHPTALNLKKNYLLWVIQNVLTIPFKQLVEYSRFLVKAHKDVLQAICQYILDKKQDESKILWRNFVKFQYCIVEQKWEAKDKLGFLEYFLYWNKQLDQQRFRLLIEKTIDGSKQEKLKEKIGVLQAKYQFDEELQQKALLDVFYLEEDVSLDVVVKSLVNYENICE